MPFFIRNCFTDRGIVRGHCHDGRTNPLTATNPPFFSIINELMILHQSTSTSMINELIFSTLSSVLDVEGPPER
ncbi:unnamed protein product, partial [Nesidiocoris tenuis]